MEPSGFRKKPRQPEGWLRYSSLAIQITALLALAAWGGHSLDKKLDFDFPWFLLGFTLMAFVGVIYWLWISVSREE